MISLEREMAKQAWRFDIISLLRLLISAGYGPHEIRFKGHDSLCSQPRMIQGVRFQRQGDTKEVEITLALGLLGAQSPLPSYFRKVLEADDSSATSFAEFIGFFDHQLIRDFLCGLYPELRVFFQGVGPLSMAEGLRAFDVRSLSTLHVLFSRAFPEAGVKVERRVLERPLAGETLKLGCGTLGRVGMLGHQTSVPVSGRHVALFCEEEETDERKPWAEEAVGRMQRLLFPILAPLAMELEVTLHIETRSRWVRLHGDCRLGYDTLRSTRPGPREMCLFKGQVSRALLDRNATPTGRKETMHDRTL